VTNGCSARTAPAPPSMEDGGGLWRLLDATGVSALAHDEAGIVVAATTAFHAALGFENGVLIGSSIDALTVGVTSDSSSHRRWTRLCRDSNGGVRVFMETEAFLDLGGESPTRVRVLSAGENGSARGIEIHSREILARGPFGVAAARRSDGMILYANPRFAEMVGKPLQEVLGAPIRDYCVDDAQRERLVERLESGLPISGVEIPFQRNDGEPSWILLSLERVDIDGTPVNLIWVQDHTERRRIEEALREMASRDPLTALHNRRSFMDLARQKLARAERFHEPLSVLVIDIDHFKHVNDTWGHAAGDEALKMVADAFNDTLREYDVVARLGGEEFVVALSDTDVESALGVAERVRRRIGRIRFPTGGADTFGLTISVGIARVETDNGGRDEDLERAIHRADIALYRSKRMGRDRSSIYRPEVM